MRTNHFAQVQRRDSVEQSIHSLFKETGYANEPQGILFLPNNTGHAQK
jgi:hypothetical protein